MQRRSMRLQRIQPPEVPQVEAPAQEEEYVRWGRGWGGCGGTAVCCWGRLTALSTAVLPGEPSRRCVGLCCWQKGSAHPEQCTACIPSEVVN